MKNKKSLFLVLFACIMMVALLVLSACGGGSNTNTETNTNSETNTNTNTNTGSTTNTNTKTEEDGPVYYIVYIVDQSGDPVEGVNLQICKDGLCLNAKYTDANGAAKFEYFEQAEFKVQINSVPDDCIQPTEEYFYFPQGDNTTFVTIQKQQTYTVNVSELTGRKLANIVVELYDEETNTLVESITTEDNGRAVFKVAPGEYYAKVKHLYNNSAYVFSGTEDGIISFKKTKNVQISVVVSDAPIDYSVKVTGAAAGAVVSLYNNDFALVDTAVVDEDGKALFEVPNNTYYAVIELDGCYVKPVIFERGKETSKETYVENVKAGIDRDHPILLPNEFNITINKGEQLWYLIPNADGKVIEIESETVIVRQGATNHTPENGALKVTLSPSVDGNATVRISTSTENDSDVFVGSIYEPGSQKTPYELDFDNALLEGMTVDVDENGRIYYTFVASKNGTITATTETENAVISINGNPFKKSVKEGDIVVICFYTELEVGDTKEHPAAEITASFEYELVNATYSVTTNVENNVSGVQIELYEKNGDTYTKIATVAADADGKYVFDNIIQTADYYVKAICPSGYETQDEYIPFKDANEITVYINHERDGSREYPFLVDAGEDNVSITEITLDGTTKCYTAIYIQGTTVSIDNADAIAKIYTVTSSDSQPELLATITGSALSYTLSGDLGTTVRVLISVEGESGETSLTLVTPKIEE